MKRVPQEQLVAFALGAGLGGAAFGFHSHVMAIFAEEMLLLH
jgi:hypothetical protein